MMQEYEDDLDEYAGYDEYDEYDEGGREEQEEEAECEEEEERQPTKEELEYLELRQRLKDSIRRKMKREGGAALANSQEKKRKLPYNDFGSFFGPSQPVISSRVIQESKSLLENEQLTSRLLNSSQASKKPVSTSSSTSKNGAYNKQSRVVNEVKKKVEKLKNTRDYSFLFSDDADLPASSKEPPSQSRHIRNSEARSAQLLGKPKQPAGINGRSAHSAREEKRTVSLNGQMQSRSSSSGCQMLSRSASGGSHMHSRPASSGSQMHLRPSLSTNGQTNSRLGSLTNGQTHLRPGSSTNVLMHQSAGRSSQPSSRLSSQKPASASRPGSVPVDHRRQLGSNNGVGPGRPAGTAKALPAKTPVPVLEKKASVLGTKNPRHSAQGPSFSRTLSSDPRKQVEQRKVAHEPSRSQMIPKQPVPFAKHQISKPLKQAPSLDVIDDRRPKKKPVKISEDQMAIKMLREMIGANRQIRPVYDDDDSDMEANFDEIMQEEKRSARIGKKEDEEQLRLIEEEERQERLRKAKKRKLRHH